jgi:hypothetical protein
MAQNTARPGTAQGRSTEMTTLRETFVTSSWRTWLDHLAQIICVVATVRFFIIAV